MNRPGVCFLSSTVYEVPLDPTNDKKFRALGQLGAMFVIGFSSTWKGRRLQQGADFVLLPRLPGAALRYLVLLTLGSGVALKLVVRREVEVLVAQSPYEGFGGAWVKLVARLLGRRVTLVVESHGDFENSPFLQHRFLWPAVSRSLAGSVSRFALRHADALRSISKSTHEQLSARAGPKPVEQFPTWTDIDVFLDAGKEKRSKANSGVLLYVGFLNPLKGVDVLLSAFASIAKNSPDARLVIIGKAEDRKYTEFLTVQARELNLASRVIFEKPLPQGELAKQMADALALVLPSRSEGLGRVVFEAMACGTPVVGSRVGGIGELIEDGENGLLVPPDNVEALAERLQWLLNNPQKAGEMGERARAFAERFFSTEGYVEAYRRLFERASRAVKEE